MTDIFGVLQITIDKRARQLASLTSQVSAQGRLIDRRLQYIDDLETQVGHHGVLTFLFSDMRFAVLVFNLFNWTFFLFIYLFVIIIFFMYHFLF